MSRKTDQAAMFVKLIFHVNRDRSGLEEAD